MKSQWKILLTEYAKWLSTPAKYLSLILALWLAWHLLEKYSTEWKLSLLMQISGGVLSSVAILSTAIENQINPLKPIAKWMKSRPTQNSIDSISFSDEINGSFELTALSIDSSFPNKGTHDEKISWLYRTLTSAKEDTHRAIQALHREIEDNKRKINRQDEKTNQRFEETKQTIHSISTKNFYIVTIGFALLTAGSILSLFIE